jgi:two-component system, LytTR family, response regulator
MMRKIKLLIVEDEQVMGRIVKGIVDVHFPEVKVLDVVSSVTSAVDAILNNRPDVVVMDIQINEGTAFDVLEMVGGLHFKVIFMSAFHDYLVEALRFSAVEFVYKPFDVSDMVSAIDKAVDKCTTDIKQMGDYDQQIRTLLENVKVEPGANKLVLTGKNAHFIVPVKDVVFVKANVSKSEFHFRHHPPFEANLPLRRFEAMLRKRGFYRCHPLCLLNLRYVDFIDPLTHHVHLKGGECLLFEPRKYDEMTKELLFLRHESSKPQTNQIS